MPLTPNNTIERVPLESKNHKSNGHAKIEEHTITIFLFILSARYPPIKPPMLPLIRKMDIAIPLFCIEIPFSVKSIDIKLMKLVMTIDRVNIIRNIIHSGREVLATSTFKPDRLALLLLTGIPGSILININARITPGRDNNHNLPNPCNETINVITKGAPASPMHPTMRKIDIWNVDLFWLKPATVATPLG